MATSNDHFAAYLRQGTVYIEDLTLSRSHEARCLPLRLPDHAVLAISALQPHLLAITNGSQILINDIVEGKLQRTISGNGRTVTALCWSPKQPNLLVSGTIDGSLCLWDLGLTAVPIAQLKLDGTCQAIACSPADVSIFASIHDGRIVLSKHASRTVWRRLRTIALDDDGMTSLSWHSLKAIHLLTGAQDGKICLWDLSAVLDVTAASVNGYDSDSSSSSDDGFFGDLDGLENAVCKLFEVNMVSPVLEVRCAGKDAFACLTDRGLRCSVWACQDTAQRAIELWSHDLGETALTLSILQQDRKPALAAVSTHGIEMCVISPDAAKEIEMGPRKDHVGHPEPSVQVTQSVGGMMQLSISTLKASKGSFSKTSKQLQHRRPSSERERDRIEESKLQLDADKHDRPSPSPPPSMSMTSSLELPKPRDEGSPMPFLSPSIPSRKPSPGELSPLDESMKLPPLPRASFDSSMQSDAATQDSDDSDDETFVDGMQGSTSFLPGGINVPLPKACAALFTPTGELLTFFPPKPRLASTRGTAKGERQADPRANAKKVARLFPTFGNLAGEQQHLEEDDDSGFESTSSVSADGGPLRLEPSYSFYPSSFASQQSWTERFSPTKHSFAEQGAHKVIVSLHDIDDIGSLLPASRRLASQYRILSETAESGADLCHHNAKVAETVGLEDVADIWRLVALVLDGRLPLDLVSGSRSADDILIIARTATEFQQKQRPNSATRANHHRESGRPRWLNSPLGAAWIVRAVFDWAEYRADTQLLAVLSAILAHAQEHMSATNLIFGQTLATQLPANQHDYFEGVGPKEQLQMLGSQPIPVLRTNSIVQSNTVHESPVKLTRTSSASSRNQSQPPTPYLESESSTPPLSLPALGRQVSHLSTSGSVSPEHHRSSFSAAAKYYAQSISDKFASYGAYSTSPPARKTDYSPSNSNEFSASFPSGSWGKSVSFASTTNTNKASILSTSYEDVQEDEGYDSDKTVEDLSQPQTPRENNDCTVTFKNDRLFDHDFDGGSEARLLPDEMALKCRLWCNYYAEQLRCWDLLYQAAELEKVCGTTCLRSTYQGEAHEEDPGTTPTLAPQASKACSICSIKMNGAQFFCSQCAHTAHLGCLEDFIQAICVDEDQAFVCPTGCGCQCDVLPFEVAVAESVREDKPKKKASFTDPRRWRARVEGDSW